VANAKELASGSGSKVNKDPNSLLRLGLPGQPKEVRELQADLEEVADSLSRLLTINANSAVGKVKGVLKSKTAAIVKATPAAGADRATQLLDAISEDVTKLAGLIGENQLGDANVVTEAALTKVSALEELIATGYTQPTPPGEFKGLPYLKGRAVVQWEVKRPGEKFDVDGALYDKLVMKTVVDGFTAPITSGNFVDLVNKGFYNGIHVQRSDGFVVQTGDPSQEPKAENKEIHGFVPAGDSKVRKIPLEVFVRGDKAPIYGTTFDDDGRGGYAATLPFNAYGALGMAREEYDADSASSQFFWLLFDSDLTPAGKNLLDGRYACFGYTIEGARFLSDMKEGDVITSAKVVEGLDQLGTV